MPRKSMRRKSMRRKSMRRKSMRRKSMRRKSMRRKSMRRKSMRRKSMRGGGVDDGTTEKLKKKIDKLMDNTLDLDYNKMNNQQARIITLMIDSITKGDKKVSELSQYLNKNNLILLN